MSWLLFSVEPPARWQAGLVGADRKPFYFDCADCGASEAPIAGFIGTGPTFAEIGVIPAGPDGFFKKPAMFCATCYASRRARLELGPDNA